MHWDFLLLPSFLYGFLLLFRDTRNMKKKTKKNTPLMMFRWSSSQPLLRRRETYFATLSVCYLKY
jgi:hypothetical protein